AGAPPAQASPTEAASPAPIPPQAAAAESAPPQPPAVPEPAVGAEATPPPPPAMEPTPQAGGVPAMSKVFNPDMAVIGNMLGALGTNHVENSPALELDEAEASFQAGG